MELCIKILSDILELLFNPLLHPVDADIMQIINTDLRTVIQSHIKMERDNPHAVSLFVEMLFFCVKN